MLAWHTLSSVCKGSGLWRLSGSCLTPGHPLAPSPQKKGRAETPSLLGPVSDCQHLTLSKYLLLHGLITYPVMKAAAILHLWRGGSVCAYPWKAELQDRWLLRWLHALITPHGDQHLPPLLVAVHLSLQEAPCTGVLGQSYLATFLLPQPAAWPFGDMLSLPKAVQGLGSPIVVIQLCHGVSPCAASPCGVWEVACMGACSSPMGWYPQQGFNPFLAPCCDRGTLCRVLGGG